MNIGNTRLAVGPLRDLGQLDETIERLERIPAISAVAVEAFVDRRVLLTVHLLSLVDLVAELRLVLGDGLVSCAVADDRLEIVLREPGTDEGETVDGTAQEEFEPVWAVPVDDGPAGAGPSGAPPQSVLGGRPDAGRGESDGSGSPWAATGDEPRARSGPGRVPTAALVPVTPPRSPAPPPESASFPGDATLMVLRAVETMSDVSILIFDRDMRIRASAGAAMRRHGRRHDDIVGRLAGDVHSPKVWRTLAPAYAATLAGGSRTVAIATPDPPVAYESSFSPIVEDGAVVGGMAITRDVTARRRERVELEESTALLEHSFASAPMATALISTDGRWLRVNRRLCEMLGRPEEAVLACTLQDVTHPDDVRADVRLGLETLSGARERYAVHKRFVRPDGHVVATRQEVALVRAQDGRPRWFVVQVVDLSAPAHAAGGLSTPGFRAA